MNETIKSILDVVETGSPELQIAGAQILGELAPHDQTVVRSLEHRLTGAEDYLVPHLQRALASIGTTPAIKALVGQLGRRDAQGDLAGFLLGEIGEGVCPVLAEAFDLVDFEVRQRILHILGRQTGPDAVRVLEKALRIPELSERAADALLGRHLETLDARARRSLKGRIVKALKDPELAPECIAAALRVLAPLDPAGSRVTLIKHAEEGDNPLVRRAALRALADLKLTPKQAESLLPLVQDNDRTNVAEPAIAALASVEKWPDAVAPMLKKLAGSSRDELRRFAIHAMRGAPHADLVKLLTKVLLEDSDGELRAAAAEALARNGHALEPLLRAFLTEKRDVERARRLAEPLHTLLADLPDKDLKAATEKAARLLFAHEATAEVVLGALLKARHDELHPLLTDKAVKLRRAKKLTDAVALLAFLAHADELDGEGRYQLALARLMLDSKAGRQENGNSGDATMGYFTRLVREGFPVFTRLRREASLKPEDLLRVGQHFSEGVGEERRFGTEILQHLAEKHARKRAGEEARLTLRAEGL